MEFVVAGWAKVKDAAQYAGVCKRTISNWRKAGLRFIRLPSGSIRIKYSWIDEYLNSFEVKEDNSLDDLVNSVVKDFRAAA